ncbi:MAG: AMP-binding protein, partial [Actinomycetes bacterium]
MNTNIGSLLTKRTLMNPSNEALFDVVQDQRFTYLELNDLTNTVAHGLLARGVKPGDRVALLLMNSTEFITTFFAIAKIGAVVVPLNWRLVSDELEFILKDSGTTVLVSGSEFVDNVKELQSRGNKTDVREWIHVGNADTLPTFALPFEQLHQGQPSTEPPVGS